MNRTIIYPGLVGKRLQKIEQDDEGNIFIHTANGFVACTIHKDQLYTSFVARSAVEEPLVVKG